ncbi:MAG: M23 family metallopeptidase [Chloroflexi bacterium]|nr:M23 family metallopeptidase [Chloroflexota bacterium]
MRLQQRPRIGGDGDSRIAAALPVPSAVVVALVLAGVLIAGFFPGAASPARPGPALRASQISLPGLAGVAVWARPAALPAAVPRPIPPRPETPPTRWGFVGRADPMIDGAWAADAASTSDVASPPVAPPLADEGELVRQPLLYRYKVQPGDTVSGLAERFDLAGYYILWNNIDVITDADFLRVGAELQMPSRPGILHGVRYGETLLEIAEEYDAKVVDIIEANELGRDGGIVAGTTILVPNGRLAQPSQPTPGLIAAAKWRYNFSWPTRNVITSYFGPSHPLGIDISAPVGTPIRASAAGTVVFVGGAACCSYGLYVEVAHGGGFTTLYAHLRNFAVKHGDAVEAGTVLGHAGLTGRTSGPHLHFELKVNGVRRNPLLYLPD